jgi:hypothetical protein
MKEAKHDDADRALPRTMGQERTDRSDPDAMSASMRELILSFGEEAPGRTWDPAAYTRRPKQVA